MSLEKLFDAIAARMKTLNVKELTTRELKPNAQLDAKLL
jgi:hypothetical protein